MPFTIECPECGEPCTATDAGFTATTCRWECDECSHAGSLPKSEAYRLACGQQTARLQHRDGLVSF